MENNIVTMACAPAAAYVPARVAAMGMSTVSGRTAHLALGALEIKGTTVSAVSPSRIREFAAATKPSVQLPITDVVVTDGGSGIRTWSPPV